MCITPVSRHTWYESNENSEQDFNQTQELQQQFTQSFALVLLIVTSPMVLQYMMTPPENCAVVKKPNTGSKRKLFHTLDHYS
jgi:hypothetical protein